MPILSPTDATKALPSSLKGLTGDMSVNSDQIYILALALKKNGILDALKNDLFLFAALAIGANMLVRRMLNRVIRCVDEGGEIFSPEERVKLLSLLESMDDNLPNETTEE